MEGFFTTMLVRRGQTFLWEERLLRIADGIKHHPLHGAPDEPAELLRIKEEVNSHGDRDLLVRLCFVPGAQGLCLKGQIEFATTPPRSLSALLCEGQSALRKFKPDLGLKSTDYANNLIARSRAREAGFDTACFCRDGMLMEFATSNVIFSTGEKLVSPKANPHMVSGITKQWVHKWCESHGVEFESRNIGVDERASYLGCISTSSVMGIVSVKEISGIRYASDSLTQTLSAAYAEESKLNAVCLEHWIESLRGIK